jgi:hypothetical protein
MIDLGNPWPEGEYFPTVGETSQLPLDEGGNFHHTKLVYEVLILHFRQRLGENFCYLLICGYVLKLHCSFMHHVSDEMVVYLYII